ncbi:MAG: proprotein convertase P-domain-containing protein [Phycisphaerales bacterium]
MTSATGFGFGAIDAGALCAAAETWTNVGPEVSATTGVQTENLVVPDNNTTGVTLTADIGEDVAIETFELILNVTTSYVGDMRIRVISPAGTESIFTTPRSDPKDNLVDYVFTSYRSWGESSAGTWTLKISDESANDVPTLVDWEIRAYGTAGATCGCDIDGNGQLNLDDINLFAAGFIGGDLSVDQDGNGVLNLDDVNVFAACFVAGCP